jgi:hypothetical protein
MRSTGGLRAGERSFRLPIHDDASHTALRVLVSYEHDLIG